MICSVGSSSWVYGHGSESDVGSCVENCAALLSSFVAGDEFRTAPLWGLGQRIYFLHDGRTSDLLEAIAAYQSRESEANSVIRNFNDLSEAQKQDVLNFLRSL
jgi:CxxC motif-containing protein (DUF1111 family)